MAHVRILSQNSIYNVCFRVASCLIHVELLEIQNRMNMLLFYVAKAPQKPIQAVYVPSHLFHMLFELFKVRF